ncbi:hypothetical protein HETIRDRAFT_453805 [Heterobasidion irregulare TC 32-1]|uniref:Uncharacterized protein n=1 Tax=Heterobasidion irregulare (strain TC 32-1) TaxID=747525 RepID=W4K0Z4_HETIT|nr:uncharacterized protein HETIRDRAFT_453805 [Heterobasidion irregulare TC 32-1]ETW79379.1 hypothetical protein HETIRDRAFT_453805 [Heterobasidion irregulare TC 32-1]
MALFKLLVDCGVVHATGEPDGRRMITVGGEQFEGLKGVGAGPSNGVRAGAGGGEKKREGADSAGTVVLDADEQP